MQIRLLPLVLAGAAAAAWADDSPLVMNQLLSLHYNQWQVTQFPTTTTSQAIYEVNVGLPVFTYRLGALSLNGTVESDRQSIYGETDAKTSLSRFGARLSLFPYRKLRLQLDYQHSETPDLFNLGSMKGDTWGVGLNLNTKVVQDVRLTYRHGTSKLRDQQDGWSLWKLEANQRLGNTQVVFQSTRQEFQARGLNQGWRLAVTNMDTESHIGREWLLRTRSNVQDTQATRWFDVAATLYGPISGSWHSLTSVSGGSASAGNFSTGLSSASESLLFNRGRWNAHATGSFSQATTKGLGQGTRIGSSVVGAAVALNPEWRIHADAGLSTLRQTFSFQDESTTTSSMNLGIARGGDLPGLVRHTLFLLSDWSFNRRVREEYPPGYVPSELAQDMMRRRISQSGNFSFTADVMRIANQKSPRLLDLARVSGQLQTRERLNLMLIGDYKHDAELTQRGLDERTTNVLANGSLRMGVTVLSGSMGYSKLHRKLVPSAPAQGPAWLGSDLDGWGRQYSVGIASRLWKMPFGVMALRSTITPELPVTTLSTWADLNFGKVSFRGRYEVSRLENGFRTKRITLDLLRWFDAVVARPW